MNIPNCSMDISDILFAHTDRIYDPFYSMGFCVFALMWQLNGNEFYCRFNEWLRGGYGHSQLELPELIMKLSTRTNIIEKLMELICESAVNSIFFLFDLESIELQQFDEFHLTWILNFFRFVNLRDHATFILFIAGGQRSIYPNASVKRVLAKECVCYLYHHHHHPIASVRRTSKSENSHDTAFNLANDADDRYHLSHLRQYQIVDSSMGQQLRCASL